ncbi:hypothetical protein [Streptomyces sp. SAI-041]|uniref:hypothetical protein n=1 Tax=Streptomyces sp. SAI-041 TaxID=2940548 RepID=UPI002475A48C|nr:hypothetical protein [Streptomyces sp. SAI-041]
MPGLGNRGYLTGGAHSAVVVLAASAARAGTTVGVAWGAVAPVAGIALLGAGGAAGAWRQGVRRRTFAVAPPAVAAFLLADAVL